MFRQISKVSALISSAFPAQNNCTRSNLKTAMADDNKIKIGIEATGAQKAGADIGQLEDTLKELRASYDAFEAARAAGDQEGAAKAFEDTIAGITLLAEESGPEFRAELETMTPLIDEARKSLKGMGDGAEKSGRDLKKLTAIDVARSLKEVVSSTSSATDSLIDFADKTEKSDGTLGDMLSTADSGVTAVSSYASAVGQATAAFGPWGIAIVAVTAALKLGAEIFRDHAAAAVAAAGKELEAAQKTADAAEQKRVAYAGVESAVEALQDSLDRSGQKYKDELASIESSTSGLKRNLAARRALLDDKLQLKLAEIEAGDGSEAEQLKAKIQAREAYNDEKDRLNQEEIKADLAAAESRRRAAEKELVDIPGSVASEAGEFSSKADSAREKEGAVPKKTAIAKENIESFLSEIDKLGNFEDQFFPDRDDSSNSEEYLAKIQTAIEKAKESAGTGLFQFNPEKLERINLLLDAARKEQERIAQLEKEGLAAGASVKENEQKAAAVKASEKARSEAAKKDLKEAKELSKELAFQLKLLKERQAIQGRTRETKNGDDQKKLAAKEKDLAAKQAAKSSRLEEKALLREGKGISSEAKNAARIAGKNVVGNALTELSRAMADGVISATEKGAVAAAQAELNARLVGAQGAQAAGIRSLTRQLEEFMRKSRNTG